MDTGSVENDSNTKQTQELELTLDFVGKSYAPWTQISQIEDGIFLGGIPTPLNDAGDNVNFSTLENPNFIVHKYGISTLISITNEPVKWNIPDHVRYLHITIPDVPEFDISILFDFVRSNIRTAIDKNSRLFIHCHAGISRSVTLLTAYYLYYGIPGNSRPQVRDVLRYIAGKRPFICPNPGFINCLLHYQYRLDIDRRVIDAVVQKK